MKNFILAPITDAKAKTLQDKVLSQIISLHIEEERKEKIRKLIKFDTLKQIMITEDYTIPRTEYNRSLALYKGQTLGYTNSQKIAENVSYIDKESILFYYPAADKYYSVDNKEDNIIEFQYHDLLLELESTIIVNDAETIINDSNITNSFVYGDYYTISRSKLFESHIVGNKNCGFKIEECNIDDSKLDDIMHIKGSNISHSTVKHSRLEGSDISKSNVERFTNYQGIKARNLDVVDQNNLIQISNIGIDKGSITFTKEYDGIHVNTDKFSGTLAEFEKWNAGNLFYKEEYKAAIEFAEKIFVIR